MKYVVPLIVLGLVVVAIASGPNSGTSTTAAMATENTNQSFAAAPTQKSDDTAKAPAKAKDPAEKPAAKAGATAAATTGPDKGIGPIKELKLGAISDTLAATGQQVFTKKCTVCHQLDTKKVGPPLRDVAKQQAPEFIMNMVLNSDEMEKKDPYVKKLIAQYQTYMSGLDLNKDQARAVLEYLRSEAEKGKPK